jgi:hypothetical protein
MHTINIVTVSVGSLSLHDSFLMALHESSSNFIPPRSCDVVPSRVSSCIRLSVSSMYQHLNDILEVRRQCPRPTLLTWVLVHVGRWQVRSGQGHYGQQLCQNPRSIQKYYAYVLVLLTLFLAVFPSGDRIQWEILWFQGGGLSCSCNLNLPGDDIKVTFEWFYILWVFQLSKSEVPSMKVHPP